MTQINFHPVINSSGNLSVQNQVFDRIDSSGITKFDNIKCLGPLVHSGNITLKNSQLNTMKVSGSIDLRDSTATDISTSGHFYASDCLNLGKVEASGQAHFINCSEIEEINVSGGFSLLNTRVKGDIIHSGKDLQINDSVINGKLECADRKVVVNNSSIEKIIIKSAGDFKFSFKCLGMELEYFNKQIVELSGKNCVVGSIYFDEGVKGVVILKNGAKVTGKIVGDFEKIS